MWPFSKNPKESPSDTDASQPAEEVVAMATRAYRSANPSAVLTRRSSSITFAVDRVDPVLTQLPATDPRAIWLARGISTLESCDHDDDVYREAEPIHGLVAALQLAYNEHRPIAISPHDVWLCVLQAIARQVEAKSEVLRPLFVSHEGKASIEIHRDGFRPGDPNNDWGGAIAELSERVLQRSSERARVFLPAPGGV